MSQITLTPKASFDGTLRLPGSKSLSNRALLLAALASGETTLTNLLDSEDVRHMLTALAQLGVKSNWQEGKLHLLGTGEPFHSTTPLTLFLGNAGTAMRPLTAALTLGKGAFTLTGEPRMYQRPIDPLIKALEQAGAQIDYLEQSGFPPLHIHANGLRGGALTIDGSLSSQFLTALLMAAPLTTEGCAITIEGDLVSKPYIDMTLKMMAAFGVQVERNGYRHFAVAGGQRYQAVPQLLIEGDASSASYFLAAAAIAGSVRVEGVGSASMQGDIAFVEVLRAMGAEVTIGADFVEVKRSELRGVDLDLNALPDAAMTLATTALFAKGTTTIRNIYNWRLKECDRLSAMATELRKVGAEVIEGDDFITITPPQTLRHAVIETYQDHRMAMCFSLLAFAECGVTIDNPECCAKTFPDYFAQFTALANSPLTA